MPDFAVRLVATDQASAVIGNVQRSLGGLESAVSATRDALAGLGVAFSVGGIIAWGKSTLDAAENLKHLSDETGSSVESLSRLKNIATVSGTSFDTFRTMLERMTVGLAGVDEESTNASKALAYLGVQSKDPAAALQEVADKLNQYADDAGKAALARDIFGRGGTQFISALKAMADAHEIAATTTRQQAEEAAKLEESIRLLGVQMTTFKNMLLSDAVPAINSWIEGVKIARQEGLGWWDSLRIGTTYADRLAPSIAAVQEQIAKVNQDIENAKKKGAAADWFLPGLEEKLATLTKQLQVLQAIDRARNKPFENLDTAFPPGISTKPPSGYASGGVNTAVAIDKTTEALDALRKSQEASLASEMKLTEVDKLYIALSNMKLGTLTKGNVEQIKGLTVIAQQRDATIAATKAAEDFAKAQHDLYEETVRENKVAAETEYALNKQKEASDQIIKSIENEVADMKLSNTEREIAIALRAQEATGIKLTGQELDDYTARLRSAVESKAALQGQIELWKSIENAAHDAFMHIFESGKSVWERLTDSLKNTLLELLYQMTVKQWVINISASVGAGAASNALASGGGGLNAIGSLGSISNMFSEGGLFMGGGSALIPSGISELLGGTSLMGGSTLGSTIGLLAPYLAPIAIGIGALVSWLNSKGGGPKTGGYASLGGIDLSGTESAAGRWFTPNQADTTLGETLKGIDKSYGDLVKALGGARGAVGFALGYDTDPQGTAPNRLHSGVWIGGKQVYNVAMSDLGRDQATLDAALQLESKRMLIAALKASDLPSQLASLFSNIEPAAMTGDAADNLLVFAQAYLQLTDVFNANPLDDALKAVTDGAKGAQAALEDQGQALLDLLATYDGTGQATADLSTATQSYYNNVVALIAKIEQMKQAISAMFASSIKTYTFSKLDSQGQYNYLRADAASLMQQMQGTTNADEINRLAAQIDADMREAFGLLSPAQQAGAADDFIKGAREANKAAADQLAKAEQEQQDNLNKILTAIKTAIEGAASGQAAAADTMGIAAMDFSAAVDRFDGSTINITLAQPAGAGIG